MSADCATLTQAEETQALIAERAKSHAWAQVNQIDRMIAEQPQTPCPLRHVFTPGLYARHITMPARQIITTRIHLFEHPFVILSGRVAVWSDAAGWEIFSAPHFGVTQPGARRVLYTLEETVWITFHPTDCTDPDELVDKLTMDPSALGHLDNLTPEQKAAVHNFCREKKVPAS